MVVVAVRSYLSHSYTSPEIHFLNLIDYISFYPIQFLPRSVNEIKSRNRCNFHCVNQDLQAA